MISFHAQRADGWGIESSDKPMKFPAGERHIIDAAPDDEVPLFVVVRGSNANHYALAAMWIDLQHRKGHKVAAIIPYLPGARQDRGEPLGALVYARIINAMQADQVITFDPHSTVMPKMIDNLTVVDSTKVVLHAVGREQYQGVIAPDKGARARAQRVADAMSVPCYQASKVRDFTTGKLSSFACEPIPEATNVLVVDDICDGGGTFLGLADATNLPASRLGLWVSHGVFSGQPKVLHQMYRRIYTTDSHPGSLRPNYADITIPIVSYLAKEIRL